MVSFGVGLFVRGDLLEALLIGLFCGTALPYLVLRFLRGRRQKAFGAQFPDGLDMIVRSLRAGHPVPIAITMVAREMKDPIGSEFGIVADEITYGADLETALRNLYFRIGQDDLPLFVTAVAIQGSTGGNLGEILENLSGVIRDRFKMRRKIRALASEGRASAHDPVVAADRHVPDHPDRGARFLRQRLARGHHQDRAAWPPAPGWGSATSSCTGWSISGSDRWRRLRTP